MCVETMDFSSKRFKSEFPLRKPTKPVGVRPKWKFVHMAKTKEAQKFCSTPTIRKFFQRQKRKHAAKLNKITERDEDVRLTPEEVIFGACLPSGAMAPRNTTQYLMDSVYDDLETTSDPPSTGYSETHEHLYCESMSPSRVYTALDSTCFEDCLDFQQRNFEDMFGLYA